MQFELDDDLRAIRELAERIFTDCATVERVRAVETAEGGFDRKLWAVLAEAGLLGVALPERAGGAGTGLLGLVTLLEQQGRRAAPVPLWSTLAAAAFPLARFGTADQVDRWLPGLLDGSTIITGVVEAEPGGSAAVRATPDGDGWRLSGELGPVPAATVADAILVPARRDSGEIAVMIVPTAHDGVTATPVQATSQESYAAVTLDGAAVAARDVLPGGGAVAEDSRRCSRLALAALQGGVCAEALRMTANYTSERVQFGRPLSTNQAVAVRAADAYLDTENIRLTTQRAAWLVDSGRENEAEAATLVAKWWASRAGLRVVHATQHLHGGIGADIDYPIHRYFLWGRQVAFSLGSAGAIGAELGDALEHIDVPGASA